MPGRGNRSRDRRADLRRVLARLAVASLAWSAPGAGAEEAARLEARIGELKAIEARIGETERKRDDEAKAKIEGLVTMYEAMKAKDAARILGRLDLPVLLAVAERMNPRKMADILAAMDPEPAQRLTVELATRGERRKPAEARAAQELPKIEARH